MLARVARAAASAGSRAFPAAASSVPRSGNAGVGDPVLLLLSRRCTTISHQSNNPTGGAAAAADSSHELLDSDHDSSAVAASGDRLYRRPSPIESSKYLPFEAEEKDLESDETLWALYHRWCKHFNQKRDHEEMLRRFGEFKKRVRLVHRVNNANLSYTLAIKHHADIPLKERHSFRPILPKYLLDRCKCSPDEVEWDDPAHKALYESP